MAGESPDRSKQRESSAEPTSGSASPVPEARSEAPPKRDPRLAVARDTERSTKRGGADTATRVFSTRTAEKPTETSDAEPAAGAERDESETDAVADAERGADDAGTAGTADAEQDAGEADTEQGVSGAGAERDESDADAEGTVTDAQRGADEADSATDAGPDDGDADADGTADAKRDAGEADTEQGVSGAGAERDAGQADSAADAGPADGDAERDENDADAEGTVTDAQRGADEADSATDAGPDDGGADAAGSADTEQDAGEADTAGDTEQDVSGAGAADDAEQDAEAEGAAVDASQESVKGSGSGERGGDAAASDGRLRDAVAAWVASADQDEEPAAAEGADKGSEDGQEAAERAEEAAEADTDAQKPEKPAEAGADDRDDREAEDTDDAAEDGAGVQEQPKGDGAQARDGREEADEPEADRSATGGAGDSEAASADSAPADDTDDASKSDDSDTDKGDTPPPVDQPTAVFKAVRPPVDQPTTMLKLGGAAKDAKTKPGKEPEKEAERTSKFVALKPLDDPSTRKPATGAQAGAQAGQATPAAKATPPAPADATAPVPAVGPERTTQQPLPPRPPLDLLAELTNTPPPPDTPLRTAVRRVKIWTPLVLLLVVLLGVVQSVRPLPAPTLDLTAEDSYTFEGGKVDIPWPAKGQAALDVQGIGSFGSSGEQKPVPIASVAKVMTAYVILRDHPLKSGQDGPKIEIDQAAEDQSDAGQESTVDVTKGDKISQREALESILIASANNVARLLARWDAGSEKAFVRKMNDAAQDLGMKNTTYTDPSGLNNTTVSTAVDQVKLGKAAMEQPAFREVAAMMSYVDYKGTKHDNWNRLVGYNDVTGIKTGTTTSALGNLVFSARKDVDGETHRIVGAVVRQPAGGPDNTILGAALYEGDRLIKAAQGALESATILKKGDVVGYADDGLGGRTPVVATEDVTAVGWAGLSVKLTFAADDLPHTAKAGTKVGTLTVGDGSSSAVKVPVALQKDLVEPGFADKLTRLG
ncbi:D-alanyl-D-alanine carboxypeptidase (penicillin-binding protein 5/6) [Streptomyces africanus]|uniref:serine-type D-Ala-D-Ala carboxypeptidase n=1 Tax=Streptomyces africanus TaxID=231024 RepID=A0ABU0QS05_9ACTN|nr:D-alanyl-D-alanine carboxypeptidase [Streptomyces africanus]MDQ0749187.1 D-alanyl-D-alanine carboxypeptidase (penicillin-binding protein 5/6) [Streptomyces africanus]